MCCCRACATKGVLLLGRLVLSLQGGLTFGGVLLLGRGLTFGGGGLVFLMVMFIVPQLRFIMSLSWVTPGTDVFYNRASTGDQVPAIVLGSSPQPGVFLRIQYEVGGKVRK